MYVCNKVLYYFPSCVLCMTSILSPVHCSSSQIKHTHTHRDRSELVIGDDNLVMLTITAVNRGEGAYETELHTLIPPEADYIGVKRKVEVNKDTLTHTFVSRESTR